MSVLVESCKLENDFISSYFIKTTIDKILFNDKSNEEYIVDIYEASQINNIELKLNNQDLLYYLGKYSNLEERYLYSIIYKDYKIMFLN